MVIYFPEALLIPPGPYWSVNLSAKISGTTGWSGTAWNTGNLFYYYTPVGGTENAVPYSASDSYDVSGASMTKGC